MEYDVVVVGWGMAGTAAAVTAHDNSARVLDPEGQPIPRLYAAGELGSIWGYLYQGVCHMQELA